jgi:hypothetical protein
MSVCDPYTYPSNCPYPNYGYSNAVPNPAPHLNILERLLGTSPSEMLYSLLLIAACAWFIHRYLWEPVQPTIAGLRNFRRLKEVKAVFLEIIPHAGSDNSPRATQELYTILQGVIGPKGVISLEYAASRDEGTRFLVRTSETDIESLQRKLASFSPAMQFRILDDSYQPEQAGTGSHCSTMELGQARHYAYPLKKQTDVAEHDLVAYITTAMAKLEHGEAIILQSIITPHYSKTTTRLHNKILHNGYAVLDHRLKNFVISRWWVWAIAVAWASVTHNVKSGLAWALVLAVVPYFMKKDKVELTAAEQRVYDQMLEKLAQPLFRVDLRVLVIANTRQRESQLAKGVYTSLASLAVPSYQKLIVKRSLPTKYGQKLLDYALANRMPSPLVTISSVLSASELADIYHVPYGDSRAEGVVKNRSRQLHAPLSLKRSDANLDVIFGVNNYAGETVPIGLALEQRQKHAYVIGKTGTGKTTMLKSAIYQDMLSGKGLAVLDPHGDLFKELLEIVPEHRRKDVVVFDPSDREWPIGLNMLDPGIEFANEDDRIELIASAVVAVFKKLADEKQWGQRMEHILNNATMTALQLPNPSLYTIQRLLTEKRYQREVAKNLKDPVLKQFWQQEFALLDSKQLASDVAPLTHRLGHFITRKMSRHILLQQKSTLRIADIMDHGKILLVNLAKGEIGADQSQFFGTVLTAFVWMAAYQRTRIPEQDRRDFFLYVDEFQNFATPDFGQITSEGRKFHVSLIVSHQNTAQIEDKSLLKTMAANSHSIITMKASPDDETFILPFMKPAVEKGDITSLAPYHFYMVTTNDGTEDAFSGETVPLDATASTETSDAVTAHSREQYATPKAEVEKQMDILFGQQTVVSPKKPGNSEPKPPTKHKNVSL